MSPPPAYLKTFLSAQAELAFARPWPVVSSALVIAALNVFLFAFDRPWTASDGLRHWGDSVFSAIGVTHQPDLLPPHLYSGSVLNIGLLVGGFVAALLSREFGIRPAPFSELVKGALGGLLMGIGAMFSFGCNIGGFFSALSALSLSGAAMMLGLIAGAFVATRYLIHENRQIIDGGGLPFMSACDAPARPAPASMAYTFQPRMGKLLILVLLAVVYLYQQLGHGRLAGFLLFGAAFGVVLQRSRFCLVNAFREPFMSGRGEHARAAALALIFSMIGIAILKAADLKDATDWVFPSFWLGSVVGGTLFGIGMVLAGGCGAGAIWRVGEGHVKLWIAVSFFAVSASLTRLLLVETGWIRALGVSVLLPNLLGWVGAVVAVVALMILWYLFSGWNEQRKQADGLTL
ncbi:MAG: hypothetical protein FJ145_12935 [Deltaproteobacteria bacterium]|nr:hypothetical protein [Deltaproteobacteria bacterium]